MKPLCIDLFCGLGGWTDGFLAEGWDCIGFDIERHDYGSGGYPGQLVLQDILTIHGSQFKNADIIVASPPCTEYSYMAMPWSRAKQIARGLRGQGEFPDGYRGSRVIEDLNALFNACFRIQREACEAAGRHIPLIVENVKGTQPWVGRSAWNFGSFHLWGDVPALMPIALGRKNSGGSWFAIANNTTSGHGQNPDGRKVAMNFHEHEKTGKPGRSFQSVAVEEGLKGFTTGLGRGHDWRQDPSGRFNSKSLGRKAASAQIAKIPFSLSSYIAQVFKPETPKVMTA